MITRAKVSSLRHPFTQKAYPLLSPRPDIPVDYSRRRKVLSIRQTTLPASSVGGTVYIGRMPKKLIEIASEIVQTQVSHTPMTAADITSSLRQVFSTLHELQRAESGQIELPKIQESAPAQALTPENSIQNDKVICLECGAEMKSLTQKHLVVHGMSMKEYKKKYGFPMKAPLAAKVLTKARKKAAKKRGLPEKLQKYIVNRKHHFKAANETATASKPKRIIPRYEGFVELPPTQPRAQKLIAGNGQGVPKQKYAHSKHELRELASSAPPRVLNAGFAEAIHGGKVLGPCDSLLAGQEYDLLVDVGPRWNKVTSLVTGNAEFPEFAFAPDTEGYLIDVLLVSGDFSPHTVSGRIWVPRSKGRSFPFAEGEPASEPGPLALRVRAPEFPKESNSNVLTVRGRLSLYFGGNLLQSAMVRVGVARRAGIPLSQDNTVDIDYVLTSSFQDVESRFYRRALQFTPEDSPEQGQPVAINIALNDDGAHGHRVVVKCDLDFAAHQGTPLPPGWVPYNPQAATKTLKRARQELLNCFWQRDDQGQVQELDGLGPNNGKSKELFVRDLGALAELGSELFEMITLPVSVEGDAMGPRDWAKTLRLTLAHSAVIQVARTENAEYAFPWALVYDIPMPGPKYELCKVLSEWQDDGLRVNPVERKECPFANTADHLENVLCPYGFWGLKHIIEQPASVLKSRNGKWELTEAQNKIRARDPVSISIAVTRDPDLSPKAISDHIDYVRALPGVRFASKEPADDVTTVRATLEDPSIVYFLCHGKFYPKFDQAYLGIGHPDDRSHQIFPKMITEWADTPKAPNLSAWSRIHPLVFINGCHTCELKPEETLQFVTAFAWAEASGILGTEISVKLSLAIPIAQFLLEATVRGEKVGQSLRQMRWQFANKGNLLGLAYTLYALADVHVERTPN